MDRCYDTILAKKGGTTSVDERASFYPGRAFLFAKKA